MRIKHQYPERINRTLITPERLNDIAFDPILSAELMSVICGKYIGGGAYRQVFEFALNNDYVIKIETEGGYSNFQEFTLYEEVNGLCNSLAWVKDWFAPISWISPNGQILCMQKTEDKPGKTKPNKVPAFFLDVKPDNFGWIGNKYVCHDYGVIFGFLRYPKKYKSIDFNLFNNY